MQIQQLQHFLAAVTYGNLGRAAEFCHITQPAITRSIQRLEDTLGVQLLERSGRGVTPTEPGKVLAEYARQLVKNNRLVRQRLADISGQPLAQVRIGVSANFAHSGLALALRDIIARHPERRVMISQDLKSTLFERLAAGDLDVAIALGPSPIDEREFEVQHLLEVRGALFAGANHPLRGRQRCDLAQLARYQWIALGPGDEGYLESRFGAYDIRVPEIPVFTDSTLLMKELLVATTMIGLAPKHTFASELKLGELVILDSELDPLSASGVIVRRRNEGRSPQLEEFIDQFHAAYLAMIKAGETSG
jgi:DNA-binding transcriptional LysR family regulator